MTADAKKSPNLESAMEGITDMFASTIMIAMARSYAAAYEENPESEETKKRAAAFLSTARECFPHKRTSAQTGIALLLGGVMRALPEKFKAEAPSKRKRKS